VKSTTLEAVSTPLRLFVYGTLKHGHSAHERLCAGALEVAPASVCGRLYLHPTGYPVLRVPARNVLAEATADAAADLAAQAAADPTAEPWAPGWPLVAGELLSFGNTAQRLAALDEYEGFVPDGSSLYRRVLVPIDAPGIAAARPSGLVAAWTYVAAAAMRGLQPIPDQSWPLRTPGPRGRSN